jgi:hypothetical protein
MTQVADREALEGADEVIDISGDTTAIAALNRSEIDMQISTAKRYPRSIARAQRRMVEMATVDQETAKSCGYALKRTDKDGKIVWIEGPSIRMAEIAVSCWGNVRYGSRVIEETDRFIVAQGICHDLETNVYNAIEVRRRITGRTGRKYGDDMIGVTANAACSIAARNAVFKVIPRVVVNVAYESAMRTAGGDEKTFSQRRGNAVAAFQKLGVTLEELVNVLGKTGGGVEDIDTTDLRRLHGLLTAINDGETTVETVFRPQSETQNAEKADRLNESLKSKVTKKPVSEGQNFEPTPEAMAEAAAKNESQAPAPPETSAGEVAPAEAGDRGSGAEGPDVSGADAEPPTDGPTEALAQEWDEARTYLIAIGFEAGAARADITKAIDVYAKLNSPKGDASKLSAAKRRELYDAIREHRLDLAGRINRG